MKNVMKNQQMALRKDPNQSNILVWSDLEAALNEERPPTGQKCPMFTF